MKLNIQYRLSVIALAASAAFLLASEPAFASIDGGYVGSSVCATCHAQKYADFSTSGHPYKYRHTGGLFPVNAPPAVGQIFEPLSSILPTPLTSAISTLTRNGLIVDADPADGMLDWSAINYVVGGFGWKARFGILDPTFSGTGYVWTGPAVQFNMHAADPVLDPAGKRADWSGYNAGTDKKYECAKCHNTNGTVYPAAYSGGCGSDDARTQPWANNPGLDRSTLRGGYYSEWTFDGVQCEACHGPGEAHASAPSSANIGKNSSKDQCGQCHTRAADDKECFGTNLEGAMTGGAADGFIKHHEQYNELVGTAAAPGVHNSLDCVMCHDPHKRAHTVTDAIASTLSIVDNNLSAEERGAIKSTGTCETCHPGKTLAYAMGNIKCIDCHMAEATKSATHEKGLWGKMGDVKTHIFKIDPTAAVNTVNDTLKNSKGKTIATNYLTVDYACGKCHDAVISTATGKALDKTTVQLAATNIHRTKPTARFLWNTDPVVSYRINFDAGNTTCISGNCTYSWNFADSSSDTGIARAVSHTYAGSTQVTVALTVNDVTLNTSSTTSQQVSPAAVNQAPTAAGLSGAATSNYTVTFTDASSDNINNSPNGIKSEVVNWGDGQISSNVAAGTAFTHTYAAGSTFTIQHTATNAAGLSATESLKVTVPQKFSVGGTVTQSDGILGLSEVTMILKYNGVTKKLITTAADGTYVLTGIIPGTYTVQPYKSGTKFSPASQTVIVGADVTGVNFTVIP